MFYIAYRLVNCPECTAEKQAPDPDGGPLVEDMTLGPQYKCVICSHVCREEFEKVATHQGRL